MQFLVKGFPLDNPPSWDEYLTFDPYRTGHIRNILIEKVSFYSEIDLNTCFHIEFYGKSTQISMSSWNYISLIAGLTRPMWMMCDPCHNYWDAVVINSILAELKTRFLRNLPFLSFVFRGMPYFGLFTNLKFSGFDGNIWWWFCYNTESDWEQGDYERNYQRRFNQMKKN